MTRQKPRRICVLAFPARRTRKNNSYAYRVQASTQPFGVATQEFGILNLLLPKWDIIHIHWPEAPLRLKLYPIRALACVLVLLALRIHQTLTRTKVVWTVHNLLPHEGRDSALRQWYYDNFVKIVDGTISLSNFGRLQLFQKWPALEERPNTVVRHGHYRDDFETFPCQSEARQRIGLKPNDKVLLSLGMIREYKNLPKLAELVMDSHSPALKVIIAGPGKCELDESKLLAAAQLDRRITVDIGLVPSEKVSVYFAACDLVVLPYKDILNSGSLLLALSLNRPALTTAMGATPEIRELVGHEWITMYDGDLNLSVIEETLRSIEGMTNNSPNMLEFDWQACGVKTANFFRSVIVPK